MEILSIVIAGVAFFIARSAKNSIVVLEKEIKNLQNGKKDVVSSASNEESIVIGKKKHNEELVLFIRKQIDTGVDESDIADKLLIIGWAKADVSEAISYVKEELSKEKNATSKPVLSWKEDSLVKWLKEDWLMKLGAALFMIGIGWFVTYAFMNNWVGPVGRITLGFLAGVAILAFGAWRMKALKDQGAVLVSVGVAVIVLTTIAARETYGFFTPFSALGIIFLTTVFSAVTSVKYKSRALSAMSMVVAYIAPLLAYIVEDEQSLLAYLLVVSGATLWVAAFTGWRFLAATSLAFVAFYSLGEGISENILILFAFAVLYFTTNVSAIIKSGKSNTADIITAVGLSVLLVIWIFFGIADAWQSLATVAWAVIFVLASFAVFKRTKNKDLVYIYSGVAIAMLGIATAMELSGAVLVLAYIYEITALVLVSALVTGNIKKAMALSMLFFIPIVLSLNSFYSSLWQNGILHKDFFVLLSLAVVLLGLGMFLFSRRKDVQGFDTGADKKNVVMVIAGALYGLALLWLSLHALYEREVATTIALVAYTFIGITMYIKGKMGDIKALHISGGILLGLVVVRLLFVEAWRLDMSGRIVVFLLIGALLVSTAFIGKSRKFNKERAIKI